MGVMHTIDPDNDVYLVECMPTPETCLLCGEILSFPLVFWNGEHATVYLHPKCAKYLGMHLIKDGLIAQGKIGPLPTKEKP